MDVVKPYDIVGIGFGPANLALAIAFEEVAPDVSIRFVETQREPVWQGAMLLDGADVQHHPCRDLVTLRNPRSRYTFINYLFETGRLIDHLNVPLHFPLRKEYAGYLRWATDQFRDLVDFATRATRIDIVDINGARLFEVHTDAGRRLHARALCLGTGRTPRVPPPFDVVDDDRVFHSCRYLDRIRGLPTPPRRVAVFGGSQSAVEVTLDMAQRFPDTEIELIVRTPGLALKDTSPFSEQGYFPAFTDYFHRASRASKDVLNEYMRRTNYSAVDEDILKRLYVLLYEQDLDGRRRVFLRTNRQPVEVAATPDAVTVVLDEVHLDQTERIDVDCVVLATGYRDLGPEPHQEHYPPLLADIISRYQFEEGHLQVNADYTLVSLTPGEPVVVLNGLCESSHGIGDAGSFSLLSLRARTIIDGLLTTRIDGVLAEARSEVGAPNGDGHPRGSNSVDEEHLRSSFGT